VATPALAYAAQADRCEGDRARERALRSALASGGLEPAAVDLLIVTSVTGVACRRSTCGSSPASGWGRTSSGCRYSGSVAGGGAGLARLHDYLLAWPGHTAALLAVELCSLHVPRTKVTTATSWRARFSATARRRSWQSGACGRAAPAARRLPG